jgi:hypothetical protein
VTILTAQRRWQSIEASFRQAAHLVQEFEPLFVEISQFSNEFTASRVPHPSRFS